MRIKTGCIFGLAVVILPLWCAAVRPYEPERVEPVLEPWRWREMTELSGRGVLCVDEADDGALWFGAIGGVIRYDGLKVEWMPIDDTVKAAVDFDLAREIRCSNILCMPDGRLLVVVDYGFLQWKDGVWSVLKKGLTSVGYDTRLIRSGDGEIWLSTPKELLRFNENLEQVERVVGMGSNESLNAFCLDANGDAWMVVMRQGMKELMHIPLLNGRIPEPTQWSTYALGASGSAGEINICAGPEGKIYYVDQWGRSETRFFDPQKQEWVVVDHPEASRGYFSLMKDRKGTLWAGGTGYLLSIRDEQCEYYSSARLGLPSIPLSIFEAEDGQWWVIARGGHVYGLDSGDGRWRTYSGLHFECDAPDGTTWFKSDHNTVVSHRADGGTWTEYSRSDGIIDSIRSVRASSHGLVWAIGRHEGLAAFSVFDGNAWKLHRLEDFATLIGTDAMLESSDKTLWFGASGARLTAPNTGGVLQYEVKQGVPRLFKHHVPPSVPYAVSCLAQTADGSIWLGSPTLYRHQVDAQTFSNVQGLPSVYTYDLAADKNGDLWVAKGLFGVYRKQGDGWRQYTEKDGMAGKLFVRLLVLQDGTLLAASDKGVNRFDGEVWMGPVFYGDFSMSSRDGDLRQSRDGTLWFNFTERDPRSPRVAMNLDRMKKFSTVGFTADGHPPETFIEEHLKQVDSSGNLHVSWSGRDPWENTAVDQLHYSWRIDGGAWSAFSKATSHTILGLGSGRHTLEVRARDRDLNIDPSPAQSRFTVALPVWRQPWFLGMVVLIVAGTAAFIWMMIYFRDRQLKARAAHLLELDQIKTSFFTNISHELRTPLTVILGPLRSMLATEKDEAKRKKLRMMERNADRIATLVGQLLEFRKIETGRMVLSITEGDLAQALQNMVATLQPLADSGGVSCTLTDVEPCVAWFDPDKLHKIVTNLVSNAIKYTPHGGQVWVKINIQTDQRGNRWAELTVEDSGTGIDPNHIHHIFERFYRIPEKSIMDGSGIGLNLTKDLVDLWGGTIRVESPIHDDEQGPGTRFTVRLPVDRAGLSDAVKVMLHGPEDAFPETKAGEAETDSVNAEETGNATRLYLDTLPLVLVVEDDADIRRFIAEGLEQRYRVEEAVDGADALEKANRLSPDLVVTDLMMPVMDGAELCRTLKSNMETSHIPVVMLTAKGSLEHQIEGLQTGADDYITKPFHMVILQTRIANLLASRKMLREQFSRDFMVSDHPLPENTPDQEFLRKVFDVLDENYSDTEFAVEQFAQQLGMSLSTLQRKLKSLLDETPAKLIWKVRLKKSTGVLKATDLRISEVAFEVGYLDPNHFSRQFKQLYGMTPSAYRTANIANKSK